MTEANLELFNLDQHHLDSEWLNQPRHYYENALKLAEARAEYERAKAERDLVEAELDRDIRNDPSTYNVPKVTEGSIEKAILLQPQYKRANETAAKAKHEVDVLYALVEALDHRKKALENLVTLQGRNYFSEPRAPSQAEEETKARTKEIKRDQAFGRNKKRGDAADDDR